MKENRLQLVEVLENKKRGKKLAKYLCKCGNYCVKEITRVARNDVRSCGCLHRESSSRNGKRNTIHGRTTSPEFRAWMSIVNYCTNPNNARYEYIGKVGIKISEDWSLFENFYRDLGDKPSIQHKLIRIDTSKDFCKENCQWSLKANPIISYKERSGEKHNKWNGYGEISGRFWNCLECRSIKSRRNKIVELNIKIEYAWDLFIKQNRKCIFSGIELVFGKNNKDTTASLDRIDSSKGYIEGNVQWVHKIVNKMKNVLPDEEFIEWCCIIAEHRGKIKDV